MEKNDFEVMNFMPTNYLVLYKITEAIYQYYAKINNIYLKDTDIEYAINIILNLGDDPIGLVDELTIDTNIIESIIDRAFCLAKVNNQSILTLDNINASIKYYKENKKIKVRQK